MDISKKIKPLGDRLIVRRLDAEEKTKSGIIIPESAKEKPLQAEVLAVGPGRWNEDGDARIAMEIKVGDIVMFKKWGADEVKIEGEEFLVLKEEDLIAVLSK
jgi:chaperonin GroES